MSARQSCVFMVVSLILYIPCTVFGQEGWEWQYPKPQGNTLNDIFIFNENTALAVGELGTVIKTTDGGETWDVQHHLNGSAKSLKNIHFINSVIGWVVREDAVLKTTNGGETWSELYDGTDCIPSLVYFLDENIGFVFGKTTKTDWGYGVCCKTINGGKTWTCSRFPSLDVHYFSSSFFVNRETGWVVGGGFGPNEIYKTTDCGQSWAQQDIIQMVFGCKAIQFVDERMGFIVAEYGVFLKTTDGGDTWEYHNLCEKYQNEDYMNIYSVHFVNADTGWIVGGGYGGFILKTTDGGENWTQEQTDIPGHLYRIRFSDPLHGWIVGQFGLIYRTTDGGMNWISQLETQYSFNDMHFIDENTGWVVGEKGIILNTLDGGEHWHKQNEADSIALSSVFAIDALNVFAVGAVIKGNWPSYTRNGTIQKTIDGGQTWITQTFDMLTEFNSIVFINDSTGWTTGTNGVLFKTIDMGNTWEQSASGLGTILDNIQFIDESTGWISFYAGRNLLKTIDGGKTWIKQYVDSNLSIYSFHFVDVDKGWVAGLHRENSSIFKTIDGENWIQSGAPPTSYYSSVYFLNENIGWAVGGYRTSGQSKSTIIKTTDSGETWHEQTGPSYNELSSVYFLDEDIGWAIGAGIFKTDTGGNIVSIKEEAILTKKLPKQIILFRNYPNPFNSLTNISFKTQNPGNVNLAIYNIMGEKLATLFEGYSTAGEFNITWNAQNCASGIYICCIKTGNQREVVKLILSK